MSYKRLISGECHVETIKNILRAIDTFDRLKGVIIQFWALIGECSSGFLLSTSKQPFAPRNPEPDLYKYRSRCVKYAYSSSSSSSSPSNSRRNIILNGLVGDAFQGHSVKVVKDLSVHKGGPLVDCALKCGLTSSVLIPCYSNNAGAGVVECCLVNPAYLSGILNLLKLAFMNMHLKWPTLQSISDLKHYHGQLGIEIDDALQAVCKTHNLALGQVWMFSKLPTTWDCNTYTSQSFVFRLSGFHNDDSDDDAIKAYYDISSLPFQMKQTLPGMAFQTRKPFFLPSMLFGGTSCSCFVIRLKSYNHPCRSYAFEFIWPECKNYLKLLESVLLTLKRSLPSFRPPPGLVKLGGELSVLNADGFEGHVCGFFNVVLKDNRFSGIPIKPSYEESTISNLEVNQHDQSTIGDADTNTNAQGLPPKPVKLFFTDMNMVSIVKKEKCTFVLSREDEHTLASIKKLIEKEFLLYPNRYKMTVDCEGESRSLESEKDFEDLKDHLEKTRTSVFDVSVELIKKGSKVI